MFSRCNKRKKHPLLAMAIGGLAVFGAYSIVSSVKCCCTEKMACIMKKMKKKGKDSECCQNETESEDC